MNEFRLTRRETEVAQLMVFGNSNKEIAARLTVTLRTVKAHISAVLAKTGTRSRTEAAYRLGSGLSRIS